MFRRLWSSGDAIKEQQVPERSPNTINELQYLEGHEDIVRHLLRIDDSRLVSASDDGKIIVWDHRSGERLATLEGHTLPITCLLLLDRTTLLSGSSDKTIRVWSTDKYECRQVLNKHQGSVKCIAKLDQRNRFCSGGNDKNLYIWRMQSGVVDLAGTIERSEEENLNCMIALNSQYIVTGSNSNVIFVYNVETMKFYKILSFHRESPQCLVQISSTQFASGSLDGTIVVWHSETLTPQRVLNQPELFVSKDHTFSYRVSMLLPFCECYLICAVGCGFDVYDINTGEVVIQCENAHDGPVTSVVALYKGGRFLTGSADSSIKLWQPPKSMSQMASSKSNQSSTRWGPFRKRPSGARAELVGEMWGHTDGITSLVALGDEGFASCSADTFVVLWKDGAQQSELRNNCAAVALLQHHDALPASFAAAQQLNRAPSIRPGSQLQTPTDGSPATASVESATNALGDEFVVEVPRHIIEYAEKLCKDKQMSVDEVAQHLRDTQGYQEAIIQATVQHLREQQQPVQATPEEPAARQTRHLWFF
eukprot:m51a1_g9244 hypothetical protein (536) ;mRNA; r:134272-136585